MQTTTKTQLLHRLGHGLLLLCALLGWLGLSADALAARIKEVAAVQGVRSNSLTGYGLVVGLDGTGDQTTQAPYTGQSLAAMLQQFGVILPPGVTMQPRNIAAVMVTRLPAPFAQPASLWTSMCPRSATPKACAAAP